MRLVCAFTFLAGLLLPGSVPAVSLELVSRTAAGEPGRADSGSIRGGSEMRPAAVLDDGAVFFVSLARLTPADTNVLADYYRAGADGAMTAVDLPGEFAAGHFFWGGTDAGGVTFYLFRQHPDPSQTVRAVNDPPHSIGMPALGGMHPDQEYRLDLGRFAEDPDTRDPGPDTLHFHRLQGAPEARIEDNDLIVSAAGATGAAPIILRLGVADREDGPVIDLGEEPAIHVRAPVEISLTADRNLISFPMMPEPSVPSLLLADPGDRGRRVSAPRASLVPGCRNCLLPRRGVMEAKRGYWIYCSEPASVPMLVVRTPPVRSRLRFLRASLRDR